MTWSPAGYSADSTSAGQCAGVQDDGARLACYDSIFRVPAVRQPGAAVGQPAASGGAAPATVTAAPATVTAAPATVTAAPATVTAAPVASRTPEEDFGLSEAAKQARSPKDEKSSPPDSITRTVTKVVRRPTGEFVVTLDDGQVWTQIDAYPAVKLESGQVVTIKKGTLGSFLLVTPRRVSTRVKRVQ